MLACDAVTVDRDAVDIAILVPCFNEEHAVAKVVADFRSLFPASVVYVYDNQSTDATVEEARRAGAVVRHERRQGKGFVVQRMLADIEADVYVLVDGDDTYEAAAAPAMVELLIAEQLDMVTGVREPADGAAAYRRGHVLGNRLFTALHRRLFGGGCTDVFSGFRVMSRRFAKSMPVTSEGFEIEAEMTAHALHVAAPMAELTCGYNERPEGSHSKLRTYRDGFRILLRSMLYLKELRPFRFFAILGLVLSVAALALGIPIVFEYLETSRVPRFPTAILSVGLQLSGFLAVACGVILDSVARGRREAKRLAYLAISAHQPSTRLADT